MAIQESGPIIASVDHVAGELTAIRPTTIADPMATIAIISSTDLSRKPWPKLHFPSSAAAAPFWAARVGDGFLRWQLCGNGSTPDLNGFFGWKGNGFWSGLVIVMGSIDSKAALFSSSLLFYLQAQTKNIITPTSRSWLSALNHPPATVDQLI
ncbi:hypothetical protein ACLOJK_012490 [Asimina triloba]